MMITGDEFRQLAVFVDCLSALERSFKQEKNSQLIQEYQPNWDP